MRKANTYNYSSKFSSKKFDEPEHVKFFPQILKWKQNQIDGLNSIISKVSDTTKQEFDDAYSAWNDYCYSLEIAHSPYLREKAQCEAFGKLVKMGREDPNVIMPLVIQKLMDPDEPLAVHLYEEITETYSALPVYNPSSKAGQYANKWLDAHIK